MPEAPIGDDHARSLVFLHNPLEKLQRRSFVPLCSDHRLQDLALMINGAPGRCQSKFSDCPGCVSLGA
jgi:hypothetical protein